MRNAVRIQETCKTDHRQDGECHGYDEDWKDFKCEHGFAKVRVLLDDNLNKFLLAPPKRAIVEVHHDDRARIDMMVSDDTLRAAAAAG